MTEIQKPEELAFAATQMISDAAHKIAKERLVMAFAVIAGTIGIVATTPTTIVPAAIFGAAYSLWDMHRLRKASLTLRSAFNDVSEGLGDHDSAQLLDPLKRAFEKVSPYSRNDLNLVAVYKVNKVHTLIMGGISIIHPIFLPLSLSSMVSDMDIKKLKAVKDATDEVQKNLRIKYPLTFDKPPEM